MVRTPLRMLAVMLLALLALGTGVHAQGVGHAGTGIAAEQRAIVEALGAKAKALDADIETFASDDGKLVDIRLQLEGINRKALESAVAFRPRLDEIARSLEQLGQPPTADQPPEPDIVTAQRLDLIAEKAEINAVIGLAEDLSIRVSRLIDRIAGMRSALFKTMLTKRYPLTEVLNDKVYQQLQTEFGNFYRSVSAALRFALTYKLNAVLAATFFALVAAAVLMIGGRRVFGRLYEVDPAAEDPSYLSRLTVAFWSTLLPSMALVVFLGATAFFYNYFQVLRGDIGAFLNGLFVLIAMVFAVNRLSSATAAPGLPNWRLVPIASRPARRLVVLVTLMAMVIGLNNFLSVVTEQMRSPLSLTIARSFLAAVVVGLILILIGKVRPFHDEDGNWRPWPVPIRYACFAVGTFTIVAALLGYIGLAFFVSVQVVVTGALLATAYIGYLSARAIGEEGAFAGTGAGRWLAARTSLQDGTIDQIGLVVSIAINLLVVALFLPLTLFMWGFQPGEIETWLYTIATGVRIGSISISLVGILSGLFVFVLGYFLTRGFQNWLDGSVMARGRVDTGVRNSIRLVVGYAGLAIAALVGISAAGIDLSNLALVAGALSLGIGFGLQNVVSNFVSGLILLAERPFKVGDWIVAGAVTGTVKKISVRATEIETFQRQTVILPNSDLINSAVGNWTHRNRLGRIEIKVSVAYGMDVRRAHALMLEIARANPSVLKNPEPFVLFANFGAAGLEFEVRVFIADILGGSAVQNDLRFAILEAFDREGIEMPSTPRAVVPRPEAPPLTDDNVAADPPEAPAEPSRRRRRPDPD